MKEKEMKKLKALNGGEEGTEGDGVGSTKGHTNSDDDDEEKSEASSESEEDSSSDDSKAGTAAGRPGTPMG